MLIDNSDPYRQIINKLAPAELRHLTRRLPKPHSVWRYNAARFEVYRVKELFNPRWTDETLTRLLIDARGSYYVYGDRPPLDDYDAKSAPYLVRAIYPFESNGREVWLEEWISDRLVPLTGFPLGSGELEFFKHEHVAVESWFQKFFFSAQENHRMYSVTSNRLCGISPYFRGDEDLCNVASKLPARLKYTGICYILICSHFLSDYLDISETRYSTSIIHDKVLEKSMTFWFGDKVLRVEFNPAYKFLGFNTPAAIRLDRFAHHLTPHKFPLYFFDSAKLAVCLSRLLATGRLTVDTFKQYCNVRAPGDKLEMPFEKMSHLGNLLSVSGPIDFGAITGEGLRGIINQEVPDGPELKISTIDAIRKNTSELLGGLKILRSA